MVINHSSFTKAWLNRLGNTIYINGQDPFSKYVKDIPITPLRTCINLGEHFINEDELAELTMISHKDLKQKFGITLYRMLATKGKTWYKGQREIVYLGRAGPGIPNELPETTVRTRGIKIEWDKLNQRVRAIGFGCGTPRGRYRDGDVTPWAYYAREKKKPHNVNAISKRDNLASLTDDLINKWRGNPKQRSIIKNIKELPVMITEEGYLLCIPKTRILPRMLIVGKSGKGKSWALNSILGRIIYIFQDRAGLMNDSLNQFYDLMCPMTQTGFLHQLAKIGNEGKPLPVVLLYMSCPGVKIRYADENAGFRLVVDFADFLYRWDYYAHGTKKWDIGSPQKYINKEIVSALRTKRNVAEIKKYLFAHLTATRGIEKKDGTKELNDGDKKMLMKWSASLESVMHDQFMSNLFINEPNTAPTWELLTDDDKIKAHPFITCYEAGLLPVVNNSLAKNYPIAKKHLSDLMHKVVDWQISREENKRRRVWIAVDELKDFLDRKGDDIYKALEYVFTQGRVNKVGFIGNIQEYTSISNKMRNNSTHLIIFELQTDVERKAIAKDYNLEKEKVDEIADLKTFQCLFTTKDKIILYDKDGRRSERKGGIWRGKVLPPISVHKSP